jgi:hypothetical protein
MNFPHVRSKPVFFCFLVAGAKIGVSVRMFGGDVSNRAQPKRASFEIKMNSRSNHQNGPRRCACGSRMVGFLWMFPSRIFTNPARKGSALMPGMDSAMT